MGLLICGRLLWQIVTAAAAGMLLSIPSPAQTRDEYQVKAAFIYNFAHFIEWPAEAFQDLRSPIVTCILGRDPFGHWLPDTIDGHSVEGHSLVIRRISKPAEAAACQILFVGASEPKRTWAAIADPPRPGILTIGESDEALDGGAVITFMIEDDRLRFEINTQSADRGKLRISSRLLNLAKIVKK